MLRVTEVARDIPLYSFVQDKLMEESENLIGQWYGETVWMPEGNGPGARIDT
ncbi:hypothetical protein [Flagellimonas marinaquae]